MSLHVMFQFILQVMFKLLNMQKRTRRYKNKTHHIILNLNMNRPYQISENESRKS